MTTSLTKADDEAQTRARIDEWTNAAHAKDVERIMSHYAPDVVAFDAIWQLRFEGAEAYGKHWEACLAMCPGPMILEIHDLDVTAREDVAFCHYLSRCGGTGPDGKEQAGWMRATVCLRKTNGKWMIVHEHFSAGLSEISCMGHDDARKGDIVWRDANSPLFLTNCWISCWRERTRRRPSRRTACWMS